MALLPMVLLLLPAVATRWHLLRARAAALATEIAAL
jgi:hypothetical protein